MTNELNINHELSQNFIDFSYEANCQRAFADARDGLKPGQRACLWEMYTKGYASNKPHVKSAKVSGGVIAAWWPHGSTAIYETFARMSQPWINNIPEIDWHGANGSIQISGEPAADRYTEARLSKASEEGLLAGIKKSNVPMKPNFCEDDEWPEVLPALYPRLMVNGCQGIGSTIANVWLPHDLITLSNSIENYLATGEIDYSQLAPSFPSGGIITNKNDLSVIYKTGKGKVVLRGRAEVDKNLIKITEIPYQVYIEPLIDSIKQLSEKDELKGITNILNKSSQNKILIEIECDEDPYIVLNRLYEKTDLQKVYNANQYALVGKTPKLLTYKEYLDIYLNHNYTCIQKEYEFDLKKSQARLHIVDGLLIALEDIDNVIALIKQSENSKDAVSRLMSTYNLSEIQGKAIVDMKLGRLARLEKIELEQEKKELISTIEECNNVISNIDRRKEIYLTRFRDFVKKYAVGRKTEITQIDPPKKTKEAKELAQVEPEKCVVIMSEAGTIKRIPVTSFRTQHRNTKGVKTKEAIVNALIRTNTQDSLMIFTDQGRMYRILVNKIPEGTNTSVGQPIKSLINMEPNEQPQMIYSIYRDTEAKFVFFVTKNGIVKKTTLEEYTATKGKNGIAAIKLHSDDEIVSVSLINDEPIALITEKGQLLIIPSSGVSVSSRNAMGVKGISLYEGDKVVAGMPIRDTNDSVTLFFNDGICKRLDKTANIISTRGGKGIKCAKATGLVTAAAMISNEDNLLVMGDKTALCVACSEIPISSRGGQGTIISKSNILSVTKI